MIHRVNQAADHLPIDWKGRAEVLKHSYDEVLAFIKHEDDKIGRVLTALAFLTAAGVTLFVFSSQSQTHPLLFTRPDVDAADVFFAGFMVSLLASLLFILGAVDPTSQIPGFLPHGPRRNSILFFRFIHRDQSEHWLDSNVRLEDLDMQLAESFRNDAMELSRRALHKVERFAESRAFVHVAIITLTLLGIARVNGADVHARWYLVVGVLIGASFLPMWDIVRMAGVQMADLRGPWLWRSVVFASPAAFAAFLLLADVSGVFPRMEFIFVSYAASVILVERFAIRNRLRWMVIGSIGMVGVGALALLANHSLGW
jgi:hypothetical protein